MDKVSPSSTQLAQVPATLTITVIEGGAARTVVLLPGQSFTVKPGMAVMIDAAGVVLDLSVDGDDILLTNPETGELYTLAGMAGLLTTETATLALFNNLTGAIDEVSIAEILAGISTAAEGGATGGGFSTANQFQNDPFGSDGGSGGAGGGGGAGSDRVTDANYLDALEGDDIVTLPDGTDVLRIFFDGKTFDAGPDADTIRGGNAEDFINGGDGDDRLYGEAAGSVHRGAVGGNDRLEGGADNDLLVGDGAAFSISGVGGNDIVLGGSGDDTLFGDVTGADDGSGGRDQLNGRTGADTLTGNSGADRLTDGADRFDYAAGDGDRGLGNITLADVIADFSDGIDLIGLDGLTFGTNAGEATFVDATVVAGANPVGTDAALVISDGLGGFSEILAILENVDVADLDGADAVTV